MDRQDSEIHSISAQNANKINNCSTGEERNGLDMDLCSKSCQFRYTDSFLSDDLMFSNNTTTFVK